MALFKAASERIPTAKNAEGQLVTVGFLDVCSLVLPVIGISRCEAPVVALAACRRTMLLTCRVAW
jgi:hypothetical protein